RQAVGVLRSRRRHEALGDQARRRDGRARERHPEGQGRLDFRPAFGHFVFVLTQSVPCRSPASCTLQKLSRHTEESMPWQRWISEAGMWMTEYVSTVVFGSS